MHLTLAVNGECPGNSIDIQFFTKHSRVESWHPLQCWCPLLREILDPPLNSDCTFHIFTAAGTYCGLGLPRVPVPVAGGRDEEEPSAGAGLYTWSAQLWEGVQDVQSLLIPKGMCVCVCVCACELNFIHEAHNCERVSQMFSHFSFLKVRDGAKNWKLGFKFTLSFTKGKSWKILEINGYS